MTNHDIVVINAGSSSIKFAAFDLDNGLQKKLSGSVENINTAPVIKIKNTEGQSLLAEHYSTPQNYAFFYDFIFAFFASQQIDIIAVGHRVVHGGKDYHQPVRITPKIIQDLKALIPYAPLHQPYNVEAIEIIAEHFPKTPQVACFDTAFHWTHPPIADMFAIPKALSHEGICRYGFHGLSYEYILSQIQLREPQKAKGRIIIAHLGNGASMCAVKAEKSIDSTMGFSTLDGLVMGTRPGNLDAGVLLYLMEFKKMDFKALQTMLYQQSGLLGVSGLSNDMRTLEEVELTQPDAKTAIDLFVYRIQREFGGLMSVLQGCDLFIFTGGIGENSHEIRSRVCQKLDWCGIYLEDRFNRENQPVISTPDSKIEVQVIPTNEELIIAKHTAKVLSLLR